MKRSKKEGIEATLFTRKRFCNRNKLRVGAEFPLREKSGTAAGKKEKEFRNELESSTVRAVPVRLHPGGAEKEETKG